MKPNPEWDAWFDLQYAVCEAVDRLLVLEGVDDMPGPVRTAVLLALIEHLAEKARLPVELSKLPWAPSQGEED